MLLPPCGDPGPWKEQVGTLGAGRTDEPSQAERLTPSWGAGGSPGSALLLFFIFSFLLLPLPWRRGLIAAQTFNSHGNCNNNMGRGPSACDIAAGGAEL